MLKFLLPLFLFTCVLAASPPTFGLKSTPRGEPVKLIQLNINANIHGPYQELEYIFTFQNSKNHSIETSFHFPDDKDFFFLKFEATFKDGQKVVGEIVDLEKGDVKSRPEFRSIAVGQLDPNETVQISFSISKPLKLHLNKFYELRFPAITKQELPLIFDHHDLKECNLRIEIYAKSEIEILASPTHFKPVSQYFNSFEERRAVYEEVTISADKGYILYFAPKYLSEADITLEVHPVNSNSRGFFLNIVPDMRHFSNGYVQTALENPTHNGLLLLQKDAFELEQRRSDRDKWHFLIDRSDSMKGSRFETLKKTLIALLQTLPEHSHINLYSFGNTLESHRIKGNHYTEYRSPNVKEAIEMVKTLEANMGEKNLFKGMKEAADSARYWKATLIVLTDGEGLNNKRLMKHISKITTDEIKICNLVIGNEMPKKTLEDLKNAGKCWTELVTENENLGDRAFHLMEKAVSQSYFHWKVDLQCKDFQEQVILQKKIVEFVLPSDQALHGWVELEDSPDFNYCQVNVTYSNGRSTSEKKSIMICRENPCSRELYPMYSTYFKYAVESDRYQRNFYHEQLRLLEAELDSLHPKDRKALIQWIIKQSKQYQILSNLTSLVPVVKKNGQSNQRDINL